MLFSLLFSLVTTSHAVSSLIINNWNVSKVEDMAVMFENARYFNQRLNKWNVSNVTDMRCMFERAHSFNQPLNNWNVSNVENMLGMFHTALVHPASSRARVPAP